MSRKAGYNVLLGWVKYVCDYHFGMMDGQGEWQMASSTSESGAQTSDMALGKCIFDNEPVYRARWEHDQRVLIERP